MNDANTKDSMPAFEAVLVPDTQMSTIGWEAPARAQSWSASVDQVLELGHRIVDYVGEHKPGNAAQYRYQLYSYRIDGTPHMRAKAICELPSWWQDLVSASKVCRSVGSCREHPEVLQENRQDCELEFDYEPNTLSLQCVAGM